MSKKKATLGPKKEESTGEIESGRRAKVRHPSMG
jgi:hypothetical protein